MAVFLGGVAVFVPLDGGAVHLLLGVFGPRQVTFGKFNQDIA
jgi:hypothetical protein